ncbi:TlpA family protein disulfide reductase [Marinoscillum pacificum]|uniref:TlpA family protein disulfide reductase n=1 Tax=Marinoscillum pacificum TaxID=392723 RepID=UPI0021579228|nr:TlpA disulfide reductase family protein [Marinoscillum pacificum]
MAKKTYKRELTEWLIIVVVGLTLYFTGLHTEAIGLLQRGLLATGIIQPNKVEEDKSADYNFLLTDINGEEVSFSEFKNQTVFLNFWATWCPPCIAEMPDIDDLYQKKGSEVSFVMISLDENRIKAKEFVEHKGYDFPIYYLKTGLPKTYSTSSIPTTYVISPAGQMVVENHGMAKYDTENFRDLLDELNQSANTSLAN